MEYLHRRTDVHYQTLANISSVFQWRSSFASAILSI